MNPFTPRLALALAAVTVAFAAAAQTAAKPPPPAATGTAGAPRDGGSEFTQFRVGNKNVKSLYAEGDVLWVGTSGGAIRYDTRKDDFKLYDAKSGLLSNGIFHVSRIKGRMAFGTYGGGLSFLDEKTGKWENFNVPEGLGDAFVYDVLQASNGDLWIATWSGVNRVRGGQLRDKSKWSLHTVENTKGGLINDWVYALAEGKDGIIWMATEGGLVRFKDGQWENWNHARGLGAPFEKVKDDIAFKSDPSKVSQHHAKQKAEMGLEGVNVAYNPNYIVALAVDRDGVVWAGTWGAGLSRYDGKSWKTWTTAEGLPGNHVSMLHVDKSGALWVGTNNGLAQMQAGKFPVLTVKDGLFANTVFSMVSTPSDGIWVGSFGGVAHVRRPRPH
ncbi:MAG: regulator [Betaproteobacteria bacterium]|nr:regulator [Betaproteobacteria bacterium]PWB61707.1 MAG: regulator [Betaproteobacteria bacterium]